MPIHDWSRTDAGIFHDFHQAWTIEIRNALNDGSLPSGFFALAEQIVSGPIAVGDPLPALPIFLTPGIYVPAPLEETYQTTWAKCPAIVRELVEQGKAEL